MRQKLAVVGGGIFGTTIARGAARAGFSVDLYERGEGLMRGATRSNQARLHFGYHYPRWPAIALRRHAEAFTSEFPRFVVRTAAHYYCVASQDSHLTGEQYLNFCRSAGLPYTVSWPRAIRAEAVDLTIRVPEALIDVEGMRGYMREDLARLGVRVFLGQAVASRSLAGYDWVVDATYGRGFARPLRWEVCETVLIGLGPAVAGISLVVMDGPFCSLDAVPGGASHSLYDVVHSVHARNVGYTPVIPGHLAPLIDRGLVMTEHSHWREMLATADRFLHGLAKPEYRGSRFTVRAVLPDADATAERPTLVEQDGRHISVLSGKLDMSVWAAKRVLEITRQDVTEENVSSAAR